MKIEKTFGGQFLLWGIRHSYNNTCMYAGLIAAAVNTALYKKHEMIEIKKFWENHMKMQVLGA